MLSQGLSFHWRRRWGIKKILVAFTKWYLACYGSIASWTKMLKRNAKEPKWLRRGCNKRRNKKQTTQYQMTIKKGFKNQWRVTGDLTVISVCNLDYLETCPFDQGFLSPLKRVWPNKKTSFSWALAYAEVGHLMCCSGQVQVCGGWERKKNCSGRWKSINWPDLIGYQQTCGKNFELMVKGKKCKRIP